MDFAIILATLAAVALLGYGYYLAIRKLNGHAQARYGHRPLTLAKLVVAALRCLLVLRALFMANSDLMNFWAGLTAPLVIMIGLFVPVAAKTSLGVAVAANALLAVAGLGIGFVILTILIGGQRAKPAAQAQAA